MERTQTWTLSHTHTQLIIFGANCFLIYSDFWLPLILSLLNKIIEYKKKNSYKLKKDKIVYLNWDKNEYKFETRNKRKKNNTFGNVYYIQTNTHAHIDKKQWDKIRKKEIFRKWKKKYNLKQEMQQWHKLFCENGKE